ncbi:UNVERIFIED_CONTAM: putative mitochondrial protein [Sesamum radiatum]|uniref:Mitochondrial protein n=1 Tax=Sesamum radiatum TaxID=300843 RepID=A0AAW2Q087_SESRA
MKILSWNCQGLGGSWKVQKLGDIIRQHKPSMKSTKKKRIQGLLQKFDMYGFSVDARSRSGGLALMWVKKLEVTLQSFSTHHIDVNVESISEDHLWRFTGFYGVPDANNRTESWNLLRLLGTRSAREWVCMGDFNEVLHQHEKFGGNQRQWRLINDFRNALDEVMLSDIGFQGDKYTWSNRREFPHTVLARLDRVCVSPAPRNGKSHRKQKVWRFEAMWLRSDDCEKVVSEAWSRNVRSDSSALLGNSESCRMGFISWSMKSFGNVKKNIEKLEERILTLQKYPATMESNSEIRECKAEIERCLAQEEIMWKQRGKAEWLKEGDRNTRFFHNKASKRYRKKNIVKLRKAQGQWCYETEEIHWIISEYFNDLFSSANPSPYLIDDVVNTVEPKVSETMNASLCTPFTANEVVKSISQMSPYKSPGPDVLIPKCDDPETVSQFRPISLCNVIYKITSKAITNRLKPFMNSIISDSQSAFIPGRLISDNILVAYEVNHFLKSKTGGKKRFAAIKLDMSKAYDRVEWCFLERMLLRSAPRISHILFADDTLIFCEATFESMQAVSRILQRYSDASGQLINFKKSSMIVSNNTDQVEADRLTSILRVRVVDKHDKYLGLPAVGGKSKSVMFAGKEILIKAVLQSIPSYAMSCFKLSISFVRQIESMIANFWWHNKRSSRVHWIAWKKIYGIKNEGSLGFRQLELFNDALLAKQAWRIIQNPSSLVSQILKAKYFPKSDFFNAKLGSRPSLTWQSILGVRQLIVAGSRWRVGNGEQICVSKDRWLPREPYFQPIRVDNASYDDFKVCISISNNGSITGWKFIWKRLVPNKVKTFAWKTCQNALPTLASLARRSVGVDNLCPVCKESEEDPKHVLLECSFSRQVWVLALLPYSIISAWPSDEEGWFKRTCHFLKSDDVDWFLMLCWALWNNRNAALMEGKHTPTIDLVCSACLKLQEFVECGRRLDLSRLMPRSLPSWIPPNPRIIKLNFDGAVFLDKSTMGVGVIARNEMGECLAWRTRHFHHSSEPELLLCGGGKILCSKETVKM